LKFYCKKQELEKAALTIGRSSPIKAISNIPEGIFLKTEGNKLFLRGYNLEFSITTKIQADIGQEGEIVLGAKIFTEVTKKIPGPMVELELRENFLTQISSNQSKFLLVGMDPGLYPELPTTQTLEKISIENLGFKKMINQTIFSTATSSSNSDPIYTGSLFDVKNERLKLISVDGYRMAVKEGPIKTEKPTKFIVPGKTLQEVLKLLPDNKNTTTIAVGQNHAIFDLGEYQLISRLIEGKFLDYEASTPKSHTTQIEIPPELLINSVERVSLVATDAAKTPIRLVLKNKTLKVFCSTGFGNASDEFPVEIEGEALEIGLNSKYLLEALKNTKKDLVKIQFNGPLSPVKIVSEKGIDFTFLILPVRLKSNQDPR
jgi:DNA polymerase-3 subunit beta